MLRSLVKIAVLPIALAACGGADNVYAPLDEVAAVAWRASGPATLTLLTVINNNSGEGAHSALMINGDQRVIFDPAGSWGAPAAPERGDVKYGITDPILANYLDFHARPAFRIVTQDITVSAEMAQRAIAMVEAHGPANKATCGRSVSGILSDLGFTQVRQSWFPKRIMRDFRSIPGVVETVIRDDTEDDYWGVPGAVVDIDIYEAPRPGQSSPS